MQVVVGDRIGVGRDDGAQELAEGDVDRRAVVEGADAHHQHVLRRLRRFGRQTVHQVRMDGARLQHAGAAGGEAHQVGGAPFVDRRNASNTAATRIAPRACGSVAV